MSNTTGAMLLAELGSLTTRVTLIDRVDGEYRMIANAETMSSSEPPYNNAAYALLETAARLAEMSGRQLISDGQLLMPQNSNGDGISHLVTVTSAAGTLGVVLTAIAGDVSARSAIHAIRSTYTSILQVVTLDDATEQPALTAGELSWIERQVQALLNLRPDAVFIAGGLEGGAVDAVNRLAHIVGLTALSTSVDMSGQQRQQVTARPVLYAGNSNAREQVISALSDRAEIFVVPNVRPALDREQLDPARQELSKIYEKQMLNRLPGIGMLRRLSSSTIRTVCDVTGLMTRFVAERYGRQLLVVDVGATSSAAYWAEPGQYALAVLGTYGTGYSATHTTSSAGIANITRWLPEATDEAELLHRVLNKQIRPQVLPSTRADLYLEHALAREALSQAVHALVEQKPNLTYDWIIARGGVLAHAPQPGLALLSILDALQPTADHANPLIDVHLDSLGLLAHCGGLAYYNTDAAITVFDRDLLSNTPLATCVVPLGEGRLGETALTVELSIVGGRTEQRTVRHGELIRIPLPIGRFGQVTFRPAPGIRIGQAEPGTEVASNAGELRGSLLGLVIDARGRPLNLATEPATQRSQLRSWLVALGVEHDPTPATTPVVAADPVPPMPTTASIAEPSAEPATSSEPAAPALVGTSEAPATPGRRISLAELAGTLEPAPPADEPSDDLAQLRQTVEAPKKRGFFGRNKD
jgi:hypothetical protein